MKITPNLNDSVGLGSAPAPGAVVGASPATLEGSKIPRRGVLSGALKPIGGGADRNTRGRVCSPFFTASFRIKTAVQLQINAIPSRLRLLTAILVAAWSCCLARPAEATVHVVARSETLGSIARKYGVSVPDLAGQNGLTKSARLSVGQRLVIPANAAAPRNAGLEPYVGGAIKSASVKPGRWRHIVIHHSGTDFGTVKGMDRYHRDERHMENGLAYHFVIGNGRGMGNGEVAVGGRWSKQLDGGHLAIEELNKISLGICLIGNFEKDRPTPQQMASLKALVTALLGRCSLNNSAVTTHQLIHPHHTQCPGRNFPTKQFLKSLPQR